MAHISVVMAYVVVAYVVMARVVMAYIVIVRMVVAYVVVAHVVVAPVVMANAVMAHLVMAHIVMAYVVMAYTVMAHIVIAYVVMAGCSAAIPSPEDDFGTLLLFSFRYIYTYMNTRPDRSGREPPTSGLRNSSCRSAPTARHVQLICNYN